MEQLLVFIVFALIALFQVLARVLRRRTPPAEEQPPAPRPREHVELEDDLELPDWARRRPVPAPAPPAPPPVPARPPVRMPPPSAPRADPPARRRRHRLGSQADLRRAIVLMEILGPPRGPRSPLADRAAMAVMPPGAQGARRPGG